MNLDELRDKARLTDVDRQGVVDRWLGDAANPLLSEMSNNDHRRFNHFMSESATDKAIAVMMEEFKVVIDGCKLLSGGPGPLYNMGWAAALEFVHQHIADLQEENHE